jgi:hypothetical protein
LLGLSRRVFEQVISWSLWLSLRRAIDGRAVVDCGCMQVTSDKRSIRRRERKYRTKLFFEPRRSIGLPSLHQGPGLPRFSRALATKSQCVRRATSSLLFHRMNAQESVLHCNSPESLYCTRRASGRRKGRPRKRIFESGHHKMRTRSKEVCCCC